VTIQWEDRDDDSNALISLARDLDGGDFPWTVSGHNWLSGAAMLISEDDDGHAGSYVWHTAGVPPGT
jgi:hypothetical protein